MSKNIICASDCSFSLPTFKFSECAPVVKEGGLCNLFFANSGNPMTNWESLSEWETRISNLDAGAEKIRALTITGDVPAPEGTEKTISHKRVVKVTKKRTLNAKIDDDSDDNYDAMRQLQCGGSFLMWYMTNAGDLYGGNEGIAISLDPDEIIPESTDENIFIQLIAKWEARISPMRIASPMPVPFTIED